MIQAPMVVDAVFRQYGRPATFRPTTGPPRSITVLSRRADADVRFGDTAVIAETAWFEVRATEVAAFRRNEQLVVDGAAFAIQSARRCDPDRLVWTVEAVAVAPEDPPVPVEPPPEQFQRGLWDGSYAALAAEPVALGQMVRLTGTGQLALAKADLDATATVAGVVVVGAAAGHLAQWTVDRPVERADWAVILDGNAGYLTPGADYYLSTQRAGGITAVPPDRPGHWLVPVGTAVSPTVLHVSLGDPVRL